MTITMTITMTLTGEEHKAIPTAVYPCCSHVEANEQAPKYE